MELELQALGHEFSVCKVENTSEIDLDGEFCFVGKTDEECSLVCITQAVPERVLAREDGWRAFRVQGVLDFSLIGILSRISAVLAENGIGIFVVSTFNTDYVLTKSEHFQRALEALSQAGYQVRQRPSR